MSRPSSIHHQFPEVPGMTQDWWHWLSHALDEHAIMAITDPQGIILYVNNHFCAVSGYSCEELVGSSHRIIKSDQHGPKFFQDLWKTISSGNIWRGTICNRTKSGSYYWVQSTILPVLDESGKPVAYLALRTDVTRLIQTEHELAGRTSELKLLFEHSPIGISWVEWGKNGAPDNYHLNRRFCEIIGLPHQEAQKFESISSATHPEDRPEQERLMEEVREGKRDKFTLEKRYIHRDGHTIWGCLTVAVLRDSTGDVTHQFAMLEDITARKAAEDEIKRTEARWRTYLATASEILYALTPDTLSYKFVSPAWTMKLGHPIDQVIGKSFFDFVHPDEVELCRNFIVGILEGRPQGMIEYRMRHLNGEWVWHASSGSVYTDRERRRAFFGVGRDISIRRKAQDELKAALAKREELERIVNRSPSVVVLWRSENGMWPVEFVSASIRQFGYTSEQFTNRELTFADITHPDDKERVQAELRNHDEAGHGEYSQEYRISCADGSFRWVHDHTVVRTDPNGAVTHHEGLITDITERVQAEKAEREMQERDLRTAAEIQQHFRPRIFPDLSEVEIETLSAASRFVGGDYYDVLSVGPRHWGFVIADVSGKGAGAALMMAECRASLRIIAQNQLSPAETVRRLNHCIQPDMRPGMFIALFYGILDLDTNVFRYCRAGHEPPLLFRRGKTEAECLPGSGLAVGFDEGEIFDPMLEECEVGMSPGDMLALYTDGITEASNAKGEEFGRDRLAAVLQRNQDRSLAEAIKTVDRYVRQFTAFTPLHDDTTLLLMRVR